MEKRVIDRDNREVATLIAPARLWWLVVVVLGCVLAGIRLAVSLLGISSVASLSLLQLGALIPILIILFKARAIGGLGWSPVVVVVATSVLGAGLAAAWWAPHATNRPFVLLVRSPRDQLGSAARIVMDQAGFQSSAVRQLDSAESGDLPALLRSASSAVIAVQTDGDTVSVVSRERGHPYLLPPAFPALSWISLDPIIFSVPVAERQSSLIVRSLVEGELQIASANSDLGVVSLITAALLIKEKLPEQLPQARAHAVEHMVRIAIQREHVDGMLLRCAQQMLAKVSTNVFRNVRDKRGKIKRKLVVKGCQEADAALLNNRALIEVALFAHTRAGDEMLLKAKRSLLTAIRCAPKQSSIAAKARANLTKLRAILPEGEDDSRAHKRRKRRRTLVSSKSHLKASVRMR